MTEESKDQTNISIEQICAAILSTVGPTSVEIENLLKDYSDKKIAVTQDSETKAVTFEIVDTPAEAEAPVEEDANTETDAE